MSAPGSLERQTGRTFWRSLDKLVEQPEFCARLEERFPALARFDLARRDIL